METTKSGSSSAGSGSKLNNTRARGPAKAYHKNCFISNDLLGGSLKEKDFLSSLDAKLRDHLEDDKKRKKGRAGLDQRPMFITTVKTGIFLDPPPDVAALLGLRSSSTSSSNTNSSSGQDILMYSYSSQPRILNNSKKNNKSRLKRDVNINNINNNINSNRKKDETIPLPCGNIMFDRRVVRGPAFVHHPMPTGGVESQAAREAEARRRAMARRKAQRARILKLRVGTPPPVEGRKHEPVQTELYLEELFDHPEERVAETQTDLMLDRPETPPFIPAKTGIDVSTQVLDGELFDFNLEVKPILEVLVGKTLEQSLVEVMEEEELEAIKEQQRRYKEMRDAERAEQQRLEEQQLRSKREMEAKVREQEEAVESQRETADRVAAAVLTTGYLEGLLPTVVSGLHHSGQLPDPKHADLQENFMSWLLHQVRAELQRTIETEDFISGVVRTVLQRRGEEYEQMEAAREEQGEGPGEEVQGEQSAGSEEEVSPASTALETDSAEIPWDQVVKQ